MTEPKTKPSAPHLRTPKAKRKLGLFVPTVHLPHDYLIRSNHLAQRPLSNRLVANLPPGRSDPSQADITESGLPEKGVRDSDELGTPETGVPESGTRAVQTARGPLRIRRAVLAQDGHSLGEQALYEALWRAAGRQSHQTRLITIGYRGMAELARLTVNNCKANIKALANKLAVEEISPYNHARARSYLIYSFPAILERRKAAGLTHYVKTRGVQFIDPESGKALSPPRAPRETTCEPRPALSGIPDSTESGIPDPGTLNTRNQNLEITTTSPSRAEEFRLTRSALTEFPGIHPNDQDILALVEKCEAVCADTEDAEIADFVRLKGSTLKAEAIKTSRMALLLKIVPQCLTGETLKLHRRRKLEEIQARQVQEAKKEAELEAMDRFWEETLRNPQQNPETRRNAAAYFVGILERAHTAPERRRRAEEAVKGFRTRAGPL